MKLLNLKRALLPIIFIGSLMTINGQVTQRIDNSKQLKTLSSPGRDYAEVMLLVSTNTGESPQGAIATFEQMDGDSIYTDTVPESGVLTFPEVWIGEYQLTVTKEGYEPYENVIYVQGEYYIEEILLIEEIIPPQNLEAETNCKDVYLDWTHNPTLKTPRSEIRKISTQGGNNSRETKQREFLGFNVYKEGVLLNEEFLSETEYVDENSLGGTYGYFVTALYSTGESESTDTVNVEVDFITPPLNFTAELQSWETVYLDWEPPVPQQYHSIQWDNGENHNAIGSEEEYNFTVASRWYPEDLGIYDSMYLEKISFYPREEDCEYYVRVWTGSESTLVVDQHVDLEDTDLHSWHTVELETPVMIDAEKELWFGYRANTQGGYPAGYDSGPAIPYHGDMIWDAETGWVSLSEYYDLDYNWNIAGTLLNQQGEQIILSELRENSTLRKNGEVKTGQINTHSQSINSDSLEVIGYNIYKNEELIEESWENTFYTENIEIPNSGVYFEYYVKAIYENGCISEPSDIDEIIFDPIGVDSYDQSKIKIHPNPANDRIKFRFDNNVEKIRIYSSTGQIIHRAAVQLMDKLTLNVSEYKPGVYIARFTAKNGKHISKSFVVAD